MICNFFDEIIKNKYTCLIIPHQSPDGDCLGSSYALSSFFDGLNIKNVIAMNDVIPTNFKFLMKDNMLSDQVILDDKMAFDVTIILDTSSPDRIGACPEVVGLGKSVLVIDHHKTNLYYGDYNVVETASSVGEILFNIIKESGGQINQEIAKGLYTSIVTDTGEFRYSNTTATTLKVAAELFDTGIDFGSINKEIYANQPLNQVKLRSEILSDMHIYRDNKIIIFQGRQARLDALGCEMFHTDGIVEAGRDIEGCEVSVLLKEQGPKKIKVSMRSNRYVDVSEVSLKFKGGGHSRAAGCTLEMTMDEAEQLILETLEEYI